MEETPKPELRKLRVFDFDDTLAKTYGKIRVAKENGTILSLSPGEYAVYEKQPGDVLDYSDFQNLVEPEEITWMTRILKNVVAKRGPNGALILSARGAIKPIRKFFKLFDLPEIQIVTLNDSDPQAKANWILYLAKQFKYDVIEFFDDSPKNVKAVADLSHSLEGHTRIITHLIQHQNTRKP